MFKRFRDENKIENESFEYRILGRSYSNGVIKVLLYKKVNNTSEQKSKLNQRNEIFNTKIMKAIKNHCAVTSVDTSTKRHYIGANQILLDATNDNEESEIIWSNKQTNNTIRAVKALILYNLMKTIQIKTLDIIEGSIEVFCNSSKVVTSINEGLMNDSQKAIKGL